MNEEEYNQEEKFDFTSEGETLGYISMDQARILALRTATEAPGDYSRVYADSRMVFDVDSAEESDDHYTIIVSITPAGEFSGRLGRERFFIEKEGPIALRQVLAIPRQRQRFPIIPMAVALFAISALVVISAAVLMGGEQSSDGPDIGLATSPTQIPTSGVLIGGGESINEPDIGSAVSPTQVPTNGDVSSVSTPSDDPKPTPLLDTPTTMPMTTTTGTHTPPEVLKGGTSRIAFSTNRDGNFEIYIMNTDGSQQTNLTNSPNDADLHPTWSPDGDRIAYTCRLGGNIGTMAEICVMNANGHNQVRITNNTSEESSPTWSPDGNRIAFVSSGDGYAHVYVMDIDGSNQIRLTHNEAGNDWPKWSPDGSEIAFVSNRNGPWDLFSMESDGSNQRPIKDDSLRRLSPAWSHDGESIAFAVDSSQGDGSGSAAIWVMQADGSNVTKITDGSVHSDMPSWSPDDSKIVFYQDREIYTMNADGTNATRLTTKTGKAMDSFPDWGP